MSIGLHLQFWIENVGSKGSLQGQPLLSPCHRPASAGNFWFWQTIWSVGDADNFRLYHTPALGYSWPLKFKRIPTQKGSPHISSLFLNSMNLFVDDLKNETLSIRIAGVDAPEVFCVPHATCHYFLSIPTVFLSSRLAISESPPNRMQQKALHGFEKRSLEK